MSLESQALAMAIQIGKDVRALKESLVGPQTDQQQTTDPIADLEQATQQNNQPAG